MGRKILGVIVGYVVSVVFVVITLALAWMALGASFAYSGDTPHSSTGWCILMLILGFVAAVLAGWVAAWIGRDQRAATWLAVLILVVGLIFAIYYASLDREAIAQEALAGRSISEVSMMESAEWAITPAWYDFAMPLIGAIGAVLGGRMRSKGAAA